MPRPRSSKNKGLPTNLYRKVVKGRTYFQYRNPTSGEYSSLGSDLAKASRAARILNARFSHSNDVEDLVARVEKPRDQLKTYIKRYREILLPAKRKRSGKALSPKTIAEYTAQLSRVEQDLGEVAVARITRRDVAEFLEKFPATYRNRFRSLLHGLFAHAVAEGLRDDNPVEGTLKATEVVRRPRLTMAEFCAAYRRAPDWLRRAMSLGLRTLQRRTDIVAWTFEDNVDGDYLLVVQQKTGARLRVRMTRHIRKAVGRGSKWLVQSNGKPVSADMLTKGFARCRPSGCQATFHEIRALGAHLLEQQGVNPQALLGHADPKMTRVYLDRHATKWIEVEI